MFEGQVEAIALRREKSGQIELVHSAVAEAGRGLVGDHIHSSLAPAAENPHDKQITLIEAESLEAVQNEDQLQLSHVESRRNVLTRGVPLNHLVGKRFRIGSLLLEGQKLCEPCSHLEKLTRKKLITPFLHRGGLRARVVQGGTLAVGDVVKEA
jgi:MOSC domain-containing protein YiiM